MDIDTLLLFVHLDLAERLEGKFMLGQVVCALGYYNSSWLCRLPCFCGQLGGISYRFEHGGRATRVTLHQHGSCVDPDAGIDPNVSTGELLIESLYMFLDGQSCMQGFLRGVFEGYWDAEE